MTRSSYKCEECKKLTIPCRMCSVGFAKHHENWADELCSVCSRQLKSWEDSLSQSTASSKHAWCSWCIEETEHRLDQSSLLFSSKFHCVSCAGVTLVCITCKQDMARAGSSWSDSFCVKCYDGFFNKKSNNSKQPHEDFWQTLQKLKLSYFASSRYNLKYVQAQLEKTSIFRENAFNQGLIRPFLLLVSLKPEVRCQIANELGWSLLTESQCSKKLFSLIFLKKKFS